MNRIQPKTVTAKIAKTAKTRQLSSIQNIIRIKIFRSAHPSGSHQRFEFEMFLCDLCALCG